MHHPDDTYLAFGTIYLVFGAGCIIFFFIGVCALLCCCRQRFRGVERKGYVIRDTDQSAALLPVPSGFQRSAMPVVIYPAQGPQNTAINLNSYPGSTPEVPPPYELPPKY